MSFHNARRYPNRVKEPPGGRVRLVCLDCGKEASAALTLDAMSVLPACCGHAMAIAGKPNPRQKIIGAALLHMHAETRADAPAPGFLPRLRGTPRPS